MRVMHTYRCRDCGADEDRPVGFLNGKQLTPDYSCLLCGGSMRRVYTAPGLSGAAVPTRMKGSR